MLPSEPASRLQKTADYRNVRKSLRTSGIWSIVFGAIALVAGFLTPPDYILATLGLVLVATGVWNITAPRPTGLVIDGVTLLLIGAYNVFDTAVSLANGGNAAPRWLILGVMQLVWGVMRIRSFGRFAEAFLEKPSDVELQQLEELVSAIRRSKPKESQDIIHLTVETTRRDVWKAKLSGDDAIFVQIAGHDVLCGTRQTAEIENRGKVMIGKALKITARVRGMELKGTMSPDDYAAFDQWKTGIVIPKAIAA
jgi:hypothetical protein